LQMKTTIVSCHTADSNPVKQEVNGTSPFSNPCQISMADSLACFEGVEVYQQVNGHMIEIVVKHNNLYGSYLTYTILRSLWVISDHRQLMSASRQPETPPSSGRIIAKPLIKVTNISTSLSITEVSVTVVTVRVVIITVLTVTVRTDTVFTVSVLSVSGLIVT
jgi:hypothetical protein